jgi:hypothetical protein
MNGEAVLERIYDWLAANYPEGPEWDRPQFHCFRDCHPVVRAVVAMDTVEGEISNGAWGQLLWNTFPNWRDVLDLAANGYDMIGATTQANAIPALAEKLAAFESKCAAAMKRAETGSFETEFGNFTSTGYMDTLFTEQTLFTNADLPQIRHEWLSANQAVVLQAITT